LLIENYGFSQRKAAQKLGLSPTAISRYISRKRGLSDELNDNYFNFIKKSLDRIVNGDNIQIQNEICKIYKNINYREIIKKNKS
jgi:predicted transcriptional regulator